MKKINRFINLIKEVVYPNTCLGCGEVINEGEYLCDLCYNELNLVRIDRQCFKCGHLKSECECKFKVMPYSGCIAPFHNEGAPQKAMYAYKLGKRPYISDFFAYKMATAIKTAFYDTEFHGICYVPISAKSLRKRGFDQSLLIAQKLSKLLNIPLIRNQLGCKHRNTDQHSASAKKRAENVKGRFYSKKRCIGNILLVDDINTTGATLNECSKQLINSGASAVYCVTGLISHGKRKTKKRR